VKTWANLFLIFVLTARYMAGLIKQVKTRDVPSVRWLFTVQKCVRLSIGIRCTNSIANFYQVKKELPESKHDSNHCRFCVRKVSSHICINKTVVTSTEEHLKFEDESALPCFWRSAKTIGRFKTTNIIYSPIVLGELTGSFQSKVDHTIFILVRIIAKIRTLDKYRRVTGLDKFLYDMVKELYNLRCLLHTLYVYFKAESVIINDVILKTKSIKKIFIISSVIKSILRSESLIADESRTKLWHCFELLFNLLNCVHRKNMTVPDSYFNRHYKTITSADFNHKWSNILKCFDSNSWTYKEMINLLIDGEYEGTRRLHMDCFVCGDEVCDIKIFRCFDTWINRPQEVILEGSVFFLSNVFSMGFTSCKKCLSSRRIIDTLNFDPNDIIGEMNAMTRTYKCDNCFHFKSRMHRCSRCLTKLYCGKDCLKQDWAVHKLCCVKNGRKRRDGQKARKNKIRKLTNKFMKEEPF